MKRCFRSPSTLIALPAVLLGSALFVKTAPAASYGLTASDNGGNSSFTTGFSPAFRLNSVAGNPATAPTAGNDYQTNAFILRGPANGTSYTFAGSSLTINSGGRFLLKSTGTTQVLTIGNLILSGGVLDLANANNDGVAAQIAGGITLASGTTSYVGTLIGETLTISSTIGGSGNLTVGGTVPNSGGDIGTVIFSGTNTYTGVTSIFGGNSAGTVLSVSSLANGGSNSSIGASSAASSNLVIGQGATLLYTGASTTTNRGFTLAANSATAIGGATISTANDLTFGGQIVAASGATTTFTKDGAGTLTYTNTTGTNTLSAGTVGNGLGYVVNNGVVNFGGTAAAPVNQTNVIGGTGAINSGTQGQLIVGTINSATSPAAELNINGGTTTVNNYAGVGRGNGTNGAVVTLRLNNDATLNVGNYSMGFDNGVAGFKTTARVFFNDNSTFTDSGVFRVGESVNAGGTSLAFVNDNATVSVTGGFSVSRAGTAVFTQNGGTVTANSGIAFADTGTTGSGTYNLNGGALKTTFLNKGTGAGTVNFNGGTLQATASDNPSAATPVVFITGLTANVQLGGAIINTNGFNVSVASTLSHAAAGVDGGLTKNGAGTLKLTAANGYNGVTTVNGGTLQIDNGSTAPSTSGSVGATTGLQVNGGGTLLLSGTNTINDRVNDAAGVTLNGGTLALSNVAEGGGGSGGLAATGTVGVGALTLQTSSIIDLQGTSLLHLATSGSQTWMGTLAIYNWNGQASGNGAEQILFGADDSVASLTQAQLNQIVFYSDGGFTPLGSAKFAGLGDGEIVPVPEPATWLGGLVLGVAALVGAVRRVRRTMLG